MRRSSAIFGASALVCTLLLLLSSRFGEEQSRLFDPKDGQVVAIRSTLTGSYLEVSPVDGRLYSTAAHASAASARFRVMRLTKPMVDMLVDAMRTANTATWANRKMVTESGCRCSGYANDHGFGSFCYPWENDVQAPWCYVTDECKSVGAHGSFGRKFEDCAPALWADAEEVEAARLREIELANYTAQVPGLHLEPSAVAHRIEQSRGGVYTAADAPAPSVAAQPRRRRSPRGRAAGAAGGA